MVAGEDPEAAGIVRQHLGHAEFHREVRDAFRRFDALLTGQPLVPQRPGQVVVEIRGQQPEPLDERFVTGEFLQPGGGHLPEQRHRVPVHLIPHLWVDRLEQILGRLVP